MNELKEVVKKSISLVSPKTICDKYGISKSTLYNWLREKKVLCVRDGAEITVKNYYILQKMYNRLKLEVKIYEKLHCFKDASNKEKKLQFQNLLAFIQYILCARC